MDKRDNELNNIQNSQEGQESRPKADGMREPRRLAKSVPPSSGTPRRPRPQGQQAKQGTGSASSGAARRPRPQGQQSGERSTAGQGRSPQRQSRPGQSRPDARQEQNRPRRMPNPDAQAKKAEGRRYIPLDEADDSRFTDIKLNKKMRTWNKYKNYIFGGIAIIVLVVIVAFSVRSCANDKKQEEESLYSKPSMGPLQVTQGADTQTQTQASTEVQTTTQAATQAAGGVVSTTKTAAAEDFTSEASYSKSVFIGDTIVSGMEYYKYLGSDKIIADTNLTASKAADKVSQLASSNPEKVYIMLGLNDLNYNSKTVDSIAQDFASLITQIKQTVPAAKIYLVSVTPITKACESKSNIYITMSNVEALNTKLKEVAATSGVTFTDINSAFQDSSGYLNSAVTGNGYNLKNEYYGFLLNTLAEMTK